MYFGKTSVEDIYIFLLVHKESNRILDGNRLAKNYYYLEDEAPQLMDIFTNIETVRNPLNNLGEEESIRLYGVSSVKTTGEKFVCDIELCYTDKSQHLVFLVIKDRAMDENNSLVDVVELVDNPVLVMDMDEQFTIHYGNYKFYQSIRHTKQRFQESYQGSYGNFFDDMRRVAFGNSVREQLEQGAECHVDIEVSYDGVYYHLFYLNAFRSGVDGRLYAVLVSIRNQSDLMKKIEYDQQYIDILQEFSRDLLFRVDVKSKTLVHRGDVSKFAGLLPEMEQFPESMGEIGLIHPNDVDGYMAFVYRMIHGQGSVFEPRLQLVSGEYEKYRLQGKPLFDERGDVVQIVGRMENIQKFVEIEQRANYDEVTSVLEEVSFHEIVEDMFTRAVQKDRFALLLLEIEDFSGLVAKDGKAIGDFLLEIAALRITNSTRTLDKVGRCGGAKFGIFFHHAPTEVAVMERAQSILHAMRREFYNDSTQYKLKTSIGVALFPEHGGGVVEMMDKATLALARAKYLGGDVATLYHRDLE